MNVQDQKFEARIAELQEQLDVANQRIAELAGKLAVHDVFQERFEATMTHQRGRAEAAERKLATAMDALKAHEAYCQSEEHDRERAYNVFAGLKYKALAQIEQPQDTPPTDTDWEYCEHCRSWHAPSLPTRHIPEEIDYREIGREMAENRYANLVHAANRGVRCRETLESLEALCKERGLTVGYGEHGQVTLSEYPKQQRPGEDPPIDACQCPACVTIRAKSRNKQ